VNHANAFRKKEQTSANVGIEVLSFKKAITQQDSILNDMHQKDKRMIDSIFENR